MNRVEVIDLSMRFGMLSATIVYCPTVLMVSILQRRLMLMFPGLRRRMASLALAVLHFRHRRLSLCLLLGNSITRYRLPQWKWLRGGHLRGTMLRTRLPADSV